MFSINCVVRSFALEVESCQGLWGPELCGSLVEGADAEDSSGPAAEPCGFDKGSASEERVCLLLLSPRERNGEPGDIEASSSSFPQPDTDGSALSVK